MGLPRRLYSALAFSVGVTLLGAGCSFRELDHAGRQCPCAHGWICGPNNLCERPPRPIQPGNPDARAPLRVDGGPVEVDAGPSPDGDVLPPDRDGGLRDGGPNPLEPLGERGLIGRWFLDDGTAAQVPPTAGDTQAPQTPLDLVDDGGDPNWVELATGRGLTWGEAGRDGRFCGPPVVGTKFTRLRPSRTATLELVIDIAEGQPALSRLANFGDGEGLWAFGLGYGGDALHPDALGFALNERDTHAAFWPVDLGSTGRVVLTLLYDSAQATPENRVRMLLDGTELAHGTGIYDQEDVPQFESVVLSAGDRLCIGNRTAGGRSPVGSIFYVALYDVVLSDAEIATHVSRLQKSDDTKYP